MPGSDANRLAARCREIEVDYETAVGVVHALRGVDVDIVPGRLTVVSGPSGSGKSSLLGVLGCLRRPLAGRVEIDGRDVTRLRARRRRRLRRRSLGIVLQDPAANLAPYLRAGEQVVFAARLRGADPTTAAETLARLGLAGRGDSYPAELSGGEQQRVAFAAAAVGRPRLLLADEPTSQLDDVAGSQLVAALRRLVDNDGVTVVVASHDPVLMEAADDVVALRNGRIDAP